MALPAGASWLEVHKEEEPEAGVGLVQRWAQEEGEAEAGMGLVQGWAQEEGEAEMGLMPG